MENYINWKEVSRKLAGNETSIQRNRIPKKYQSKVQDLLDHIKAWEEKNMATEQEPTKDEDAQT